TRARNGIPATAPKLVGGAEIPACCAWATVAMAAPAASAPAAPAPVRSDRRETPDFATVPLSAVESIVSSMGTSSSPLRCRDTARKVPCGESRILHGFSLRIFPPPDTFSFVGKQTGVNPRSMRVLPPGVTIGAYGGHRLKPMALRRRLVSVRRLRGGDHAEIPET